MTLIEERLRHELNTYADHTSFEPDLPALHRQRRRKHAARTAATVLSAAVILAAGVVATSRLRSNQSTTPSGTPTPTTQSVAFPEIVGASPPEYGYTIDADGWNVDALVVTQPDAFASAKRRDSRLSVLMNSNISGSKRWLLQRRDSGFTGPQVAVAMSPPITVADIAQRDYKGVNNRAVFMSDSGLPVSALVQVEGQSDPYIMQGEGISEGELLALIEDLTMGPDGPTFEQANRWSVIGSTDLQTAITIVVGPGITERDEQEYSIVVGDTAETAFFGFAEARPTSVGSIVLSDGAVMEAFFAPEVSGESVLLLVAADSIRSVVIVGPEGSNADTLLAVAKLLKPLNESTWITLANQVAERSPLDSMPVEPLAEPRRSAPGPLPSAQELEGLVPETGPSIRAGECSPGQAGVVVASICTPVGTASPGWAVVDLGSDKTFDDWHVVIIDAGTPLWAESDVSLFQLNTESFEGWSGQAVSGQQWIGAIRVGDRIVNVLVEGPRSSFVENVPDESFLLRYSGTNLDGVRVTLSLAMDYGADDIGQWTPLVDDPIKQSAYRAVLNKAAGALSEVQVVLECTSYDCIIGSTGEGKLVTIGLAPPDGVIARMAMPGMRRLSFADRGRVVAEWGTPPGSASPMTFEELEQRAKNTLSELP
jgi:hypothetical protein